MLTHFINSIINFYQDQTWIVDNGLILFSSLILSWIAFIFYKKVEPRLAHRQHVWLQALIRALHYPLQFLIWGVAFAVMFERLPFAETNAFDKYVSVIEKVCVIATLLWFFLAYINQVESLIHRQIDRKKRNLDKTSVTALCQLSQVFAIVMVGLVLMQNLGVSVSAILAFGGMGGLAVGFAAKDALSNYFGGLMIFFDRPFSVGDHVASPDQEIEGTVERIGWRLTKIRTPEKRLLFVPNGIFSNISIENVTRMTHRRIKTNFNLKLSDAPKAELICNKIVEMIKNHPKMDPEERIVVNVQDISAALLNFMVIAHTQRVSTVLYYQIQQDIILNILAVLNEVGAVCESPSGTLYLTKEIDPEKF